MNNRGMELEQATTGEPERDPGQTAAHPPLPIAPIAPGRVAPTVGPGGHAAGMDPALRASALQRLKRIEGQVRGLQRMVEDERYCADVLMQIASVHEALRGVGKLLMRNHLEHCVTEALRSGDALAAERAYGEVLELMYRHAR